MDKQGMFGLQLQRFGPSIGRHPADIAEQVGRFLDRRSDAPLAAWWMPWLVNLAAVPFVLFVGAVIGEVLLRSMGLLNTTPTR